MTESILRDTLDNGTIENVHLSPIGKFTGSDSKGNPVDENLTRESLEKLAEKLNAGDEVLMDIDHQSAKAGAEKNTAAVGWFSKFVVDPIKGLFATLKLTKAGKQMIENREYRYTSPAFILDDNGEPVDLCSVAATNLPAFKGYVRPIINTQPNDDLEKENSNMTREELKAAVLEVLAELKAEEDKKEQAEEKEQEEEKTEEVKEALGTCDAEKADKEVKNSCDACKPEIAEAVKNEEAPVEEVKKDEVIKIEALNTSPVNITSEPSWKKMSQTEFIKFINSGKYKTEL